MMFEAMAKEDSNASRVSDRCKQCGKAMMEQVDPLCCACRYGERSFAGYRNAKAEEDCVTYFESPKGFRIIKGLNILSLIEEDPADKDDND
jgi:ribosomal protein L37E